ncbi:hypothetical protein ACFQ21_17095 [Ohtaekwangia kribbensis]|jgi:hypothetical protein|uniref:General stress protein CsbD n=1 Tax=Ohtaekwangia kribbensis TaxID=688913 RepID=A0ABW3K5F3_9BACT
MIGLHTSSKANSRWEAQKTKLKKQFPALTDADLDFDETNKVTMFEALELKLSIPAKELQLIIETL